MTRSLSSGIRRLVKYLTTPVRSALVRTDITPAKGDKRVLVLCKWLITLLGDFLSSQEPWSLDVSEVAVRELVIGLFFGI